ncbi:Lrp/AsnC family transcriptional regulator [Nakamurella deserti]|uniref:Lrp/AsnC family transcriptional regulator n=1 Tax=Nakamurella deserti TaxID=2164074 RepID=UPI000DBE79A8|nr:Lrp/AsnC family transcriptional regulator [Nakamurella deserti]
MGELDQIDRQIIAFLVRDARATFAEIGTEVSLSAPAVKRRVDRLVETGIIRGFTAVVDAAAAGWSTEAIVEVYCSGTVAPQALQRAWEGVPEVVGAWTVTGAPDAVLRVVTRDVRHLEQALERIRSAEHIDHSETVIVLSTLIDRHSPATTD